MTRNDRAEAERAGATLRALREARGISQSELASALLISTPYLCNIEAGRKRITPTLAVAAADALSVPAVALVRRDVLDEQAA